jgi:hypothetical protein
MTGGQEEEGRRNKALKTQEASLKVLFFWGGVYVMCVGV